MVHITESTVGRRYAGWFIKNTERTQKILDDLKGVPLPSSRSSQGQQRQPQAADSAQQVNAPKAGGERKVAWGGVKTTA